MKNITIKFENVATGNKQLLFDKLTELLEDKLFTDWMEEPKIY